ncbi:S8 family peptidase [Rhodoferax mekongensis]|uniref:S8 family serine peptidase n=1 Tax=Rhodoferax mekongensis TaxID=3068341 RepID=A0ABZ0B3X0_9BURK|nr:S8 family serine peptidase [Rhodoferax sp. TBRC 17307]WNO06533.1 S8 family serine peptidase [Rhodoferax sp. TBRC 17307]
MKDRMASAASEASSGKVKGLSYLRAVSGNSHVYLTDNTLDRSSMQTVIQALSRDPAIESVSIDERMVAHAFSPNDTAYVNNTQWQLKAPTTDLGAANFAAAWNRMTPASAPVSGENVVVAVLDSGYRPHADLADNLVGGYDFIRLDADGSAFTANDGNGRDTDAQDPGDWNTQASACDLQSKSSWHGTRVAGIVAAVTDNNPGTPGTTDLFAMAGAAYKAKVLPARVLGVCGGYVSDVVDAIRWAAGISVNGLTNPFPAKVINLSLGGAGTCNTQYQTAIDEVRNTKNVTVVASTGNDRSTSTITQPANCRHVIAVTAHRKDGTSPVFANVGAGTTLSAPGVEIYSTSNDGAQTPGSDTFASENGTSFSAPMVSSVAAMLYQIKPAITPDEVTSRITNSVRSFPVSTYCSNNYMCGAGLLDADAAVAQTVDNDTPYAYASASQTQNVARGSSVTLTGVAGAGTRGNSLATVQWTQISGPTVTISNAAGNVATILTPANSIDNLLVFRFRATTLSPDAKTADAYVTISLASAADASSGGGGGGGGSVDGLSLLFLAGLSLLAMFMAAMVRKHSY